MNKREGIDITKAEFENFLNKFYNWAEFSEEMYSIDFLGDKDGDNFKKAAHETREFCYMIPIVGKVCILVFSSISRNTGEMRNYASDAIRIVPFETEKFKSIMPRQGKVYRVLGWSKNFRKRVDYIVEKLGNNMKCQKCGKKMTVRKSKSKEIFIGCTGYPKCSYTKNIVVFNDLA